MPIANSTGMSRVKKRARLPTGRIPSITIRDFSGLLYTAESDLNLQTKFAARMVNMERGLDGTISVRYGTRKVGDASSLVGTPFYTTFGGSASNVSSIAGTINSNIMTIIYCQRYIAPGNFVEFDSAEFEGVTMGGRNIEADMGTRKLVTACTPDGEGTFTLSILMPGFFTSTANFGFNSGDINMHIVSDVTANSKIIHGVEFKGRHVTVDDNGNIVLYDLNWEPTLIWSDTISQKFGFQKGLTGVTDQIQFQSGSTKVYYLLPAVGEMNTRVGGSLRISGMQETTIAGVPTKRFNTVHQVTDVGYVVNESDTPGDYVSVVNDGYRFPASGVSTAFYYLEFDIGTAATQTIRGVPSCTVERTEGDSWGPASFVSSTVFDENLLIANGVDKPIAINFDGEVFTNYIRDPATFDNTNVPIGKYIHTHDQYVVIAGVADEPDTVYVSNTNTFTTWPGDADPNDATTIMLGRVIGEGNVTVKSLSSAEDLLVIGFASNLVFYRLGSFVEDVHLPTFVSKRDGIGSLSHKAARSIGEDTYVLDNGGLVDLREVILQDRFRPRRTSDPVVGVITKRILNLTELSLDEKVWAVYHRRKGQYMISIPNKNIQTENWVFVFTSLPEQGIRGWTLFRGWNFTAGWQSSLDKIYFARGLEVYVHGSEFDPIIDDYEGTTSEKPIQFIYEFPWMDFNDRLRTKITRHILLETFGNSRFTMQMFADGQYYDATGLPAVTDIEDDFQRPLDPALEVEFRAGDSTGWSQGSTSIQDYGGGRNTAYQRLFAWPAKVRIVKPRFFGSTDKVYVGSTKSFALVSLTMNYKPGDIRL